MWWCHPAPLLHTCWSCSKIHGCSFHQVKTSGRKLSLQHLLSLCVIQIMRCLMTLSRTLRPKTRCEWPGSEGRGLRTLDDITRAEGRQVVFLLLFYYVWRRRHLGWDTVYPWDSNPPTIPLIHDILIHFNSRVCISVLLPETRSSSSL